VSGQSVRLLACPAAGGGGGYQNGGRVSEALDFYRRTLVTAGDDYHRLVAIEAIVYLLRSRQRYDEALQEIDSFLTEFNPGQDTRSYLSLSRSQLLVRLQRIDEAVSGIQEKFKAGELTETHAGECLEEIAVDLLSGPGSLKSEEIYRWIMANLPEFQRNSRFLGNYAHVLETRGFLDEAIETRVLLIKEFPDDERRCEHLLEAANLLSSQGKYTEAIEYYERIEGLNATRDSDRAIKVLAKKNLESAKARNETSRAVKPIEDVPRSNSYQVILIVNLILVVGVGFAWFRARRRA
jgi:tetratricopeptide (TPR) repeat protein